MSAFKGLFLKRRIDGTRLVQLQHQDLFRMGIKATDAQTELVNKVAAVRDQASSFNPENPLLWSAARVGSWLTGAGFDAYRLAFKKNNIDGPKLLRLSEDDLMKTYHFSDNDIRQMLAHIERLKNRDMSVLKQRMSPDWSVADVLCWLENKGFGKHMHLFEQASVDGVTLRSMKAVDLVRIGVQDPLEQTKLLDAIDSQKNEDVERTLKFSAVNEWSTEDVCDWLTVHCDLEAVTPVIREQNINGRVLLSLQPATLVEIGITTLQNQMGLMQSIDRLRHEQHKALLQKERFEMEQASHVNAPWFKPDLAEAEAKSMVADMEPGCFVVTRLGSRNHMLYFNNNGKVEALKVETTSSGLRVPNGKRMYPSLSTMIGMFSNDSTTELPCVLQPMLMMAGGSRAQQQPVREPWNKLGQPADVAVAALQGAENGMFVVHGLSTSKATLSYVCDNEVRNENVGTTSGSLSGPGVFLVSAPQAVYADLNSLVEAVKQGHPALPGKLTPLSHDISRTIAARRATRTQQAFCWWQIDAEPAAAEALLADTVTGSFVIYRKPQATNRYILAYRFGDHTEHEELATRNITSGLLRAGVYLVQSQNEVFPSLQDLVQAHCEVQRKLKCVLVVHKHPESGLQLHELANPVETSPTKAQRPPLAWLQPDTPVADALSTISLKGPGTFIVTCTNQGAEINLVYKGTPNVNVEPIVTVADPAFKGFCLAKNRTRFFTTLLDLLVFYSESSPDLDCPLNRWQLRLNSGAIDESRQSLSWAWCQVGCPVFSALDAIRKLPEGCFVVRSGDAGNNRLVLSYVCGQDIRNENICPVEGQSPSVYLGANPRKIFSDIHDMLVSVMCVN